MNKPDFDFAAENVPLAPCTLYNVGGPARIALIPRNESEAERAYAWMCAQTVPSLILGGGSNVLIADEGFSGIVFFTTALTRFEDFGDHRYFLGSGKDLDWLVREVMLPNNYEGVGGLTGIPGSVGGAIYMNAGTVNGSTCQFLESVSLLKPRGPYTIPIDETLYNYRGQSFCDVGDVILGGTFQFKRSERDQQPIFEHYIERRRVSQPQGYCCGSVFKNPPGDHAGKLIEACGLKGTRRGGAIISPMHANFIMNENKATFDDIFGLIQQVKEAVLAKFGIALEEEVRIIQ